MGIHVLDQRVEVTLVENDLPVLGLRPRLGRSTAFWVAAASLATMTAFSTAPSALYGIYAREDHLSSLAVTLVYAVYGAGVLVSLLLVGHVSDWYGRRTVLVPALLTALLASAVFARSSSLPALLVGRALTGVALGAAVAAATAYLTDLDDESGGGVPTRRSQVVATVASAGGLAVGPLLSGLLAGYVTSDPRMIALVFTGLLVLALGGTLLAPEGRPLPEVRRPYRPQRLTLPAEIRARVAPALVGDFLVFTVFGVFAGLASAVLGGTLHRPSPVLAGLVVFVSFGVGALVQVATITWPLERLLATGVPLLLAGLALVVVAVWVRPPSLLLFFVGAGLAGAGAGAIFRSTLTVVIAAAPPTERAGTLTLFFVVGYAGLSLPVVTSGVALGIVSSGVVLLALAASVATGVVLASPMLLGLSSDGRPADDRPHCHTHIPTLRSVR